MVHRFVFFDGVCFDLLVCELLVVLALLVTFPEGPTNIPSQPSCQLMKEGLITGNAPSLPCMVCFVFSTRLLVPAGCTCKVQLLRHGSLLCLFLPKRARMTTWKYQDHLWVACLIGCLNERLIGVSWKNEHLSGLENLQMTVECLHSLVRPRRLELITLAFLPFIDG